MNNTVFLQECNGRNQIVDPIHKPNEIHITEASLQNNATQTCSTKMQNNKISAFKITVNLKNIYQLTLFFS